MYPQSMFRAKIRKKYQNISTEYFQFLQLETSLILHGHIFVMFDVLSCMSYLSSLVQNIAIRRFQVKSLIKQKLDDGSQSCSARSLRLFILLIK